MNMITVTAKTLDEAITKALIELGTTSDNLDYEIVDKGSTGFLGLFAKYYSWLVLLCVCLCMCERVHRCVSDVHVFVGGKDRGYTGV